MPFDVLISCPIPVKEMLFAIVITAYFVAKVKLRKASDLILQSFATSKSSRRYVLCCNESNSSAFMKLWSSLSGQHEPLRR